MKKPTENFENKKLEEIQEALFFSAKKTIFHLGEIWEEIAKIKQKIKKLEEAKKND